MASLPDPRTSARPWVASYPPGVPPTYQLPEVRLPRLLDDAARDFPEHAAVEFHGRALSYAQLRDHVDAAARALRELADDGDGTLQGQRVLVRLPEGFAAPVVLLALWRVGAVAVPVHPQLSAARLAQVAEAAQVTGVVADAAAVRRLTETELPLRFLVRVRGDEWRPPRRPGPLRHLPTPRLASLPHPFRGRQRDTDEDGDPGAPRVAAMVDLLPTGGPKPVRPRPVLPADGPALVAVDLPDPAVDDDEDHDTGADTDDPTAPILTEHTHRTLLATAFQSRLWVPDVQAGRERVMVATPLHDVVGIAVGFLAAVLSGATTILTDADDPGELAREIERTAPTLLVARGPRVASLLEPGDAARRDLTCLRVCLAIGDGLAPQLARDLERRTAGARVRPVVGVGDAAPLTHAQPVYGRVVPSTQGLPITSTVAMVVDVDDPTRLLAPDEVGRLLVHGPQIPPVVDHLELRDGWLVTDLLARVDEQGWFSLVGVSDEVVEVGGLLRSPARIRAALLPHPGVRDVEVVEVDGELIAAVVTARRRAPDVDTLRAALSLPLAPTDQPDDLVSLERLPRDDDGYLDVPELADRVRARLRERAEQATLHPDAAADAAPDTHASGS